MKIASTLMTHGDTPCVNDTIEAMQRYLTNDILMLVDGAYWEDWGKDADVPVYKMSGFHHNFFRGCYRNITLGLMKVVDLFPDADWYCHTEYDTLFVSDAFKEDLEKAEADGVWCMGNDCRTGYFELPFLEYIVGGKISVTKYMLGCCIFYHRDFLHKLKNIDLFNRLLYLTNDFSRGYFPDYDEQGGWELAEHLYPTLANLFGGRVRGQAYYSTEGWHGNYERYALRWQPELTMDDVFPGASILHPVKVYDCPIRAHFREKRND